MFCWVNSGDHDMYVPSLGTQAWIRSLNYSVIDDWRPWMIGDQIAGYITFFLFILLLIYFYCCMNSLDLLYFGRYTRTYANNMTFVTIKASLSLFPLKHFDSCFCHFIFIN